MYGKQEATIKMGRKSRAKGVRFEKMIEAKLQEALGRPFARRTNKGFGDIDVYIDNCVFLIEAKDNQDVQIEDAFKQSCEWAEIAAKEYKEELIPVAIRRRKPRSKFLDVMMWLSDLVRPQKLQGPMKELRVIIPFEDFVNYLLWRKNLHLVN